jgi:hypothetical protein
MKRKYLVRFYCGTDCRTEIGVWALDEVRAMVIAFDKSGIED